jgi:hypothetical protein
MHETGCTRPLIERELDRSRAITKVQLIQDMPWKFVLME